LLKLALSAALTCPGAARDERWEEVITVLLKTERVMPVLSIMKSG
jgi:hypothetical protein